MTDRYRVLALDQRGHGESAWAPADRYGIDDMADDLEAFVRALDLRAFTLLGLSMGGMVAMEYGGRRPQALAACVIVDIGPEIVESGSQRIQSGVRAGDVFASRDEAFAIARAANSLPPEAHHRHRSDNSLMRTEDGRWTYRYDRALRTPSNLRRRDAETLAILRQHRGADTDHSRRPVRHPVARDRRADDADDPDARVAVVANAGHGVPLDAPEEFLAATRNF